LSQKSSQDDYGLQKQEKKEEKYGLEAVRMRLPLNGFLASIN